MLTYARLPRNKILLNWPIHGNDIYLDAINMSTQEREKAYKTAKLQTLGYLYYIQNELGYKHIGLAEDEYPTSDQLPFIPYNREGRRFAGQFFLTANDMEKPFAQTTPAYRTGIAVGDYPLDHHHKERPDIETEEGDFPGIPSFSIPLGCLVPEATPHLILCEKGISVSHVANGATRLQPCVLLTGQAAGALAAQCILQKREPENISIRSVQSALLDAHCFLMPYLDIWPQSPVWRAAQEMGASGLMFGVGKPYQWANQTCFFPDSTIQNTELLYGFQQWQPGFYASVRIAPKSLTIAESLEMVQALIQNEPVLYSTVARSARASNQYLSKYTADNWSSKWHLTNYQPERPIRRGELALLLKHVLEPFAREVDWKGFFINH
jgi:hypothetical protein